MIRPTTKIFIILALTAALAIALYTVRDTWQDGGSVVEPQPKDTQGQQLTRFTSEELGLSFSYPAAGGDLRINSYSGESGEGFQGIIAVPDCGMSQCEEVAVHFGGVSAGFSAPRSQSATEDSAFIEQDDRFYFEMSDGSVREIEYPVERITANNATGIILTGEDKGGMLRLGPNEKKAIFNLNAPRFQAVSFVWDSTVISDDRVEAILKTVVIE